MPRSGFRPRTALLLTSGIVAALLFPASAKGESAPAVPAPPPPLQAEGAVLMDLSTGQVLYAKNPTLHLYPASITKIMTALLALKKGRLSDPIRVSALAASQPPNKVYLVPGEVEPLKKMLYGLLIDSGNDAAVAIAQRYGGSVAGFARMMNLEAWRLGCRNTHFVNPNGLQNPDHYTCAYDMALIARRAMQIPEFRKIVDTKYYLWRGKEWTSYLSNLNQLLWTYPGANGVKTGWTNHAEQTIVVTATRGKLSLLAVLMHVNGLQTVNQEAAALLNYGFSNFHQGVVIPKGAYLGAAALGGKTSALSAAAPAYGAVPDSRETPPAAPDWVRVPLRTNQCALAWTKPRPAGESLVKPSVRALRLSPPVQNLPANRRVGSAIVRYQGATFSVPVVLRSPLPAPAGKSADRPPLWPEISLAALAMFAFSASLRRRKARGGVYPARTPYRPEM